MILEKEYVKTIAKKTKEKQNIVSLVMLEYSKICIKLLINGNFIVFPKNFGTVELVRTDWDEKSLKRAKERYAKIDYSSKTKSNFILNYNTNYKMFIYPFGNLAAKMKFVIERNLKQYRYVNK